MASNSDSPKATRIVGKGVQRVDGAERVMGTAQYGADLSLPGTFHAKIKRSPYANAKINKINVEKAMAIPGVVAIVTSKDFPEIELSDQVVGGEITMTPRDQRRMQLAEETVFYHGQAIAAVAATSLEIAESAVENIEIEYEVLEPVVNVEEAVKESSPLVHDDLYTWEFAGSLSDKPSNIARRVELSRGDHIEAFKNSDLIVERRFEGGTVHQGYI